MASDHTMKSVARETGLTPHTIRAWERRYGALTPGRTQSNHRLYSDEDIERLVLLRTAVETGRSIGRIAGLGIEELRSLVDRSRAPHEGAPALPAPPVAPEALLEEAMGAIDRLDTGALESILARAAASLGIAAMMDQVTAPLLRRLGEGWRDGSVRIANEHMASVILHQHLMRALATYQPPPPAPGLIVTTPANQHHEFGALMVAVTAASLGWRVLYLGSNLPAQEIAGAVHRSGARCLALSIVYPPDDSILAEELRMLRRGAGAAIPILVGGRSAAAYSGALRAIGAIVLTDMDSLRTELDRIRSAAIGGGEPAGRVES